MIVDVLFICRCRIPRVASGLGRDFTTAECDESVGDRHLTKSDGTGQSDEPSEWSEPSQREQAEADDEAAEDERPDYE
jgi:hypothetical protein